MKIQSVKSFNQNNQNLSFKSGKLNILAMSDNHGNVRTLPNVEKTVKKFRNEIFPKSDEKSTVNVFAIAGDYFINPSKRGFRTQMNRKKTNGDVQAGFLTKLIHSVKNMLNPTSNFETVFTMGNHDLDGGDRFILNTLSSQPLTTLVTNVDMEKSPIVENLMKQGKDFVKSKVVEIDDDKDPNLKHHALFLGVTIPAMDFYNPGLLKEMEFYDNSNKKDAQLKEGDLQQTFECIRQQVSKFKKEYPKGAVILLSHTGNRISEMIRDQVKDINIIINGHDHLEKTTPQGQTTTTIFSMGKDNELLRSLSLEFDDFGDLKPISEISERLYRPLNADMNDGQSSEIKDFMDENFKEDVTPIVVVRGLSGEIDILDYDESIRFSNSYLANYLTSAVKSSVRKIRPSIDAIAIQSSIIRGGIRDKSSNLDLMKIFDGVSEDLATVKVGKVSGKQLVDLIAENVNDNLKNKTRNTLLQWSDIQINRTLISQINSGEVKDKKYEDAIKIRDKQTKEFVPIVLDQDYEILLPQKYLLKENIKSPKLIRDQFESIEGTYDSFLRQYLDDVNYEVVITSKTKEARII